MNTLLGMLRNPGPDIYYDGKFRQILEDHLHYLKQHPTTEEITVDAQSAVRGDGDLISVLIDYDIPRHLHWLIMRINGMTSPMDYRSDQTSLLIPPQGLVEKLIKRHRVTQKIVASG